MKKNTEKSRPLTIEEKIEAKLKAIQDAADESKKQVKFQVGVSQQLADVCEAIKKFDDVVRGEILSENIKTLNKIGLGLNTLAGGDGSKASKAQVSLNEICEFLSANGEKSTGEIETHFAISSVTVAQKLKALKSSKKIDFRKDPAKKTRKLWKVLKS